MRTRTQNNTRCKISSFPCVNEKTVIVPRAWMCVFLSISLQNVWCCKYISKSVLHAVTCWHCDTLTHPKNCCSLTDINMMCNSFDRELKKRGRNKIKNYSKLILFVHTTEKRLCLKYCKLQCSVWKVAWLPANLDTSSGFCCFIPTLHLLFCSVLHLI